MGDRDLIGLLGGLVGLLGDLVLTLGGVGPLARAGVPGLPGTLGVVKLSLAGVGLPAAGVLLSERVTFAVARGGELATERAPGLPQARHTSHIAQLALQLLCAQDRPLRLLAGTLRA